MKFHCKDAPDTQSQWRFSEKGSGTQWNPKNGHETVHCTGAAADAPDNGRFVNRFTHEWSVCVCRKQHN